ncbi:MAG: hypothetical protein ABIH68_01235 [bacterium]
MITKTRPLQVSLILILCLAVNSFAGFGESGWLIFRKAQSTRFKALSAATAVNGDLSGIFYNPALTATNKKNELFFLSELGFAEDSLMGLVFGRPLTNGGLAAGVINYDAGKMELNWIEGTELKSEEVSAQKDTMGIVSYALNLKKNIQAGLNIKIASSEIAERQKAAAWASDLGILYSPFTGLSLSAAVNNIGTAGKFINEKEPLPAGAYYGAAYSLGTEKKRLVMAAGAGYNMQDNEAVSEIGAEFVLRSISFNAGYKMNIEQENLHFGLGISYKSFKLALAYIPGVYLNSVQRLSIGYGF